VTALIVSMFTLGLVTSLHCVSMCGPMVVSYALKGTEDEHWTKRVLPNFAYQGAKILSYVLVGLALGAIGSAFNLDGVRPYIMIVAGVFMLVLGLGMTGLAPWATRLTPRPPKFLMNALTKTRRKAVSDAKEGTSSIGTPITFGLLTGLFPCAPLQGAQLAAAATGSVLGGGTAMLAFGLGTAPLMLAFGTASSLIPRDWKNRLMVGLAVVVMVFGLVYVNRGLMRLGSPVTFQSAKTAMLGGTPSASAAGSAAYTTAVDGVVEVPLVIENTQFVPSTVSIPADKPVRLVVERREANACSDQIALPQLGVLADLAPNAVTNVDLPATKAGTYTLTCGMGMMSGQLVVGSAAAGTSRPSPVPWVALALVGTGGGYWAVSRREKALPAKKAPRRGPFGLTYPQLVLACGGVALAAIAGLVAGGFFGS
jgi:sulfite exporter TauE/SafE